MMDRFKKTIIVKTCRYKNTAKLSSSQAKKTPDSDLSSNSSSYSDYYIESDSNLAMHFFSRDKPDPVTHPEAHFKYIARRLSKLQNNSKWRKSMPEMRTPEIMSAAQASAVSFEAYGDIVRSEGKLPAEDVRNTEHVENTWSTATVEPMENMVALTRQVANSSERAPQPTVARAKTDPLPERDTRPIQRRNTVPIPPRIDRELVGDVTDFDPTFRKYIETQPSPQALKWGEALHDFEAANSDLWSGFPQCKEHSEWAFDDDADEEPDPEQVILLSKDESDCLKAISTGRENIPKDIADDLMERGYVLPDAEQRVAMLPQINTGDLGIREVESEENIPKGIADGLMERGYILPDAEQRVAMLPQINTGDLGIREVESDDGGSGEVEYLVPPPVLVKAKRTRWRIKSLRRNETEKMNWYDKLCSLVKS